MPPAARAGHSFDFRRFPYFSPSSTQLGRPRSWRIRHRSMRILSNPRTGILGGVGRGSYLVPQCHRCRALSLWRPVVLLRRSRVHHPRCGGAAGKINTKMVQLEGRKAELEQALVDAEEPPPLLHPEMATFYRQQVSALHEALQADTEATRLKAGEVLRSLVKEIVLTPGDGELKIDVRGDLAGILAVALKTKTPATRAGVSQFEMVAGIGFEPMTFRL